MNKSWLLSATLLAIAIAPAPWSAAEALADSKRGDSAPMTQSASNAAQQLAPAILSSVRENRERLEGVELSITMDLKNRGVTETTTTETPLPNGGRVIETRSPSRTYIQRVVALEDRLRVDQLNGGDAPAITYWFDGVRWTESNADAHRVMKMWPHQMGFRKMDPREVVGFDTRSSLSAILADDALAEAALTTNGSISTITTSTFAGQKMVVDFDARVSLLPTRYLLFHLNGALSGEVITSYVHVPARNAWILETVTDHIYAESDDGLAHPDLWKQELRTNVRHRILPRSEAETQLVATVPEGFRVIDHTVDATMTPRKRLAAAAAQSADSPLRWFIVAQFILIPVATGMYFWRRRRTSPV